MMRMDTTKITKVIIVIFFLASGAVLLSQEDEHGRSPDLILNEIMRDQNVDTIADINPEMVDEETLEELGDAVMGLMVGDAEQHELMDNMMGGEGSQQLDSAHRWMGYQYLENNGNLNGFGPGMMGRSMMGPGMMYGQGYMNGWNSDSRGRWMMNGWYGADDHMSRYAPWFWILGLSIVAGVIVLIIILSRRGGNHVNLPENALEILKSRYAKGEISREEYRQMREELQ